MENIDICCPKSPYTLSSYKWLSYVTVALLITNGVYFISRGSLREPPVIKYDKVVGSYKFVNNITLGLGVALLLIGIFMTSSIYMKGYGMLLIGMTSTVVLIIIMSCFGLYTAVSAQLGSSRYAVRQAMTPAFSWNYKQLRDEGFFLMQRDLMCCGVYYWRDFQRKEDKRTPSFLNYRNQTLPTSCCDSACTIPLQMEDNRFKSNLHGRGCLFVATEQVTGLLLSAGLNCVLSGIVHFVGVIVLWGYTCAVYNHFY